jgi:hypothetical protein
MARRESRELGLAGGNRSGSVTPFQGGGNRPEQAQAEFTPGLDLVQGLLSIGGQYAGKRFDQEAQDKYLEGTVAAQLGQSLDEVETNPITAAFARGGYNDERYRGIQAEGMQDYQKWLAAEGRALAPDDPRVIEAIRTNSNRTTAAMSPGMTARAKTQALLQQNKTNEAMITTHNKAHKDFIIEQVSAQILPEGNGIIKDLVKARATNDPMTYRANTDRAALFYNDLLNNEKLSPEMRQDIALQFVSGMLAEDQREPVQLLMEEGFLDTLPFEEREKIAEKLEASANRTVAQDISHKIGRNALFEQDVLAGRRPLSELPEYIDEGIRDRWMSVSHAMSLYDKASKGLGNTKLTADLLSALNRRQVDGANGIHALGSNVPETMKLLDDSLRSTGANSLQRLGTMVPLALDLGHFPKAYGEEIGQAVRQIGATAPGEPLSTEALGTLTLVTSLVGASGRDAPYRSAVLLGAMPEDAQGAMAHVLAQSEFGVPAAEAIRDFWAKDKALKEQNPAQKQLTALEKREAYSTAINASHPTGFWGSLFGGAQRVSSDPGTEEVLQSQVWAEARRIERDPRMAAVSEEELIAIAAGNVAQRTIPITAGGTTTPAIPLVVDKHTDLQGMFGTSDRTVIGQALTEAYPVAPNAETSFFTWDTVNKRVINKQLDEQGREIARTPVNSDDLRDVITARQQEALDKNVALTFGTPREVGGRLLTIDGRNAANLPPSTALQARELILKAAPDKVVPLSAEGEGRVLSAQFRNASDLALARANLQVGRAYVNQNAKAAIAASVFVDGVDATEKRIKAATIALDRGDTEAFNKIMDQIPNEEIRKALKATLPTGRTETQAPVIRTGGFPVM